MEHIRCLTLLVTNRCPLNCAHCGPRSGPAERGDLGAAAICAALDGAASMGCDIVNLSGGEPFVLGSRLEEIVRDTVARGLYVRVTTGAYWAVDASAARRRIEPLAAAGLTQLCVSATDEHEEFVDPLNVVRAVSAAR